MTTPLDPVVAEIIPLLPLRDPTVMTPQSARDALRALAASRAAVPPPPVASAIDIEVKGAAGKLAARVYRVSDKQSPTMVFFHGGGWVAGDLDTHDRQARLLAIETGAVVVSVDYRRPPETRFPGAFEDGFAALRDVIARIVEFGGDSTRLGVAGDSAGGNLAAAVAIACRDAGFELAAQLLVYPVTDVAGAYADASEPDRSGARSSVGTRARPALGRIRSGLCRASGRGSGARPAGARGRHREGLRQRARSARPAARRDDGRRSRVRRLWAHHGAQWCLLQVPELRQLDGLQLTRPWLGHPRVGCRPTRLMPRPLRSHY